MSAFHILIQCKTTSIILTSLILLNTSHSFSQPADPSQRPNKFLERDVAPKEAKLIPGDIVIKYKDEMLPPAGDFEKRDETLKDLATTFNSQFHSETIAIYPHMGWIRVQIPPQAHDSVVQILDQDNRVEYWMENYAVTLHGHTSAIPPQPADWLWNNHNGTNSSYLWGLDRIEMERVWALSNTQGGSVLIAILDTGIDDHTDLIGQLRTGASFCGSPKPVDKHGHGTYVAGIIGAKGDNGPNQGNKNFFVGTNRTADILPIRIDCSAKGAKVGPNIADAIAGINYAVNQRAAVINGSWGLYGLSKTDLQVQLLKTAIEAGRSTTLYVASAGNDDRNLNSCSIPPIWPQMFSLDSLENLIVVAGTDVTDGLMVENPGTPPPPECPTNTPFASNYGNQVVHLGAPGQDIWSLPRRADMGNGTNPLQDFVLVNSGTSAAAPFVAGCAALLQHRQRIMNPSSTLSPAQVKSILMSTGEIKPILQGKVASNARLDCYQALLTVQTPH
jgi:subtilisin family serine protease